MHAAVCRAFGQPLGIEEVELDPPGPGEVTVRLAATGICHSDVHVVRGDWGGALPVVAGHEAAGVVVAVGADITLTQPGAVVVVTLLRSCGRCYFCATGALHLCEGRFALATESRLHAREGDPIRQGLGVGAFAEQVVVDQSQVVQVPADLPPDRAALLGCGVITGVGAVVNTARVAPGSSVVVLGSGGVGLNSVQGAVLVGAQRIIAVDLLDAKLAAARAFGATDTVNARQHDPVAAVVELTAGRGADYVFVTVGSADAVARGFDMLGQQGTLVIVGIPRRGATVMLPVDQFPIKERRVVGSSMGSTRLQVDVPRLVELYRQGRLKLDELITARYPLEQINEAIEAMETGAALRNVILFPSDC